MSGSDISDEEAILPAVGVLDDLDSDVSFSDSDDPALQDYAAEDAAWKRRQETKGEDDVGGEGGGGARGEGEEGIGERDNGHGDYEVRSDFWTSISTRDSEARMKAAGIPQSQKEEIRRKAAARDQAIMKGEFIPCPRFTIERRGYEFRTAAQAEALKNELNVPEYGSGYYETEERRETLLATSSPWPAAMGGKLRIGLYSFAL